MAHVDSAPQRGTRQLNANINLVPYIDLLVTLMTFLMITAAWSSFSALTAAASSGGSAAVVEQREPVLIDVLESSTRGLEALAGATPDAPIRVRVEDGVHHGRIIEVLDQIAQHKLGPATVEPMPAP